MSVSRSLGFIVIVFAALMVASASIGDTDTPQKEERIAWANEPDVLVGLKAVNLHIGFRGAFKNVKVGEQWLTTRVEQRLRKVGLTVLTDEEAVSEETPTMLTILIDCRGIEGQGNRQQASSDGVMYLARITLDDIVVPYRDDQSVILGATTWSRRHFGHAGATELASKSMDAALALVDEFCLDFARARRSPAAP
ncbi:MAG: hypothetical protein KAV82_04260 [Phycisphaerae bacterium]|nr:hypothetical protein [Phycisphaerae bacterium]